MKYGMITLILALSMMAWAQTASQDATSQSSTAASPKAGCCCDKADAKDAHSCCAHRDMSATNMSAKDMTPKDGKEAMSCAGKDPKSCCSGKDGMSGMRADRDKDQAKVVDKDKDADNAKDKDKTAASCGDCMKSHEKNCCATPNDGDNKTAMSCCKEHCTAHASAATVN